MFCDIDSFCDILLMATITLDNDHNIFMHVGKFSLVTIIEVSQVSCPVFIQVLVSVLMPYISDRSMRERECGCCGWDCYCV